MILNEFTEFNYTPEIVEGVGGIKKVVMSGVFQRAESPNGNRRVYPKRLLEREINRLNNYITERRMIGELDHPPGEVKPRLREASHIITFLEMRGNDVFGKLEILNTTRGRDLMALHEAGVRIGVSSRATGGLRPLPNGLSEVDDSFCLNTFDVVNEPSVQGAYVAESLLKNYNQNTLNILKKKLYFIF
jgi:hypothetical protein